MPPSSSPPLPASPESSSSVISDDDLERLDELLSEPPYTERALPLDAMQGVFYALSMGPDEVPESTWMPAVLGADPDGEPEDVPEEVADLLRRFLAETANDVREGRFDLLLYENRMRRLDYAPWCGGFLDGLDIADTDWYEAADPDEMAELLFPLVVLAGDLPEAERKRYKPDEWRDLVRDCEEGLETTLRALRDYWNVVKSPPQTLRRDGPKVGRNDPCPCGSGRKFKQCHGKTE